MPFVVSSPASAATITTHKPSFESAAVTIELMSPLRSVSTGTAGAAPAAASYLNIDALLDAFERRLDGCRFGIEAVP